MTIADKKEKKTIGILGGMGPEATVRLFDLIVQQTRAEKDSDHIPVIIMNCPEIPDRTAAITGRGESPLPHLIQAAKILERAGADFIAMPCVTAHHYYGDITQEIHIPFIHMIQETAHYIIKEMPEWKCLGLLATSGTLETGLFQRALGNKKFQIFTPDSAQQRQVMEAIYGKQGIKAGFKDKPREILSLVAVQLKQSGARALIAGCTEIALVIEELGSDLPVINPLRILASVAIQAVGCQKVI